MDIWATTLVDIWATQFQLTLKFMWTIDRATLTCKVDKLLSFSQDGHKGNGPEWSLGPVIIYLAVLKIEKCLPSLHVNYCHTMLWYGLLFNPVIVHVDFELAAMKVLKEIFWNVSIKCYRFHLAQVQSD